LLPFPGGSLPRRYRAGALPVTQHPQTASTFHGCRVAGAIKAAQCESEASQEEVDRSDDVARHFDDVAQMLAALDIERTWAAAATEVERRVLLDEFLKEITVLPDYIDVNIHGAPSIHVLYQEVGLKESEFDRVGGGTPTCFGGLQPSPLDRVQGRASCIFRVVSLE
jgi:hypothetical protein